MPRVREKGYFFNWSCSASIIWKERNKSVRDWREKKGGIYRERENLFCVTDNRRFFGNTIGSDLENKRRVWTHFLWIRSTKKEAVSSRANTASKSYFLLLIYILHRDFVIDVVIWTIPFYLYRYKNYLYNYYSFVLFFK